MSNYEKYRDEKIENNTIIHGRDEVQDMISHTLSVLSKVIGSTIGPRGAYTIGNFNNNDSLIINDGVTIINHIKFSGHNANIYNLILERIKGAAQNVNEHVGDGTSTCIVMIDALFKLGTIHSRTENPILIGRGMELALNRMLSFIKKNAKPIKKTQDIIDIATISSRQINIGKMIGNAIEKIGKNGSIICTEGNATETILEINQGFTIDSGVVSSGFLKKQLKISLKNPLILVTDYSISTLEQLIKIFESYSEITKNSEDNGLLIIAKEFKGQALQIALSALQQGRQMVAIKSPSFGDEQIAKDICALTNATFFSKSENMLWKDFNSKMFGRVHDLETSLHTTTFIVNPEEYSDNLQSRIDEIKMAINNESSEYAKKGLQERLYKLSGGVANIKIGGANEKDIKDLKYLVQDAISATQAAIETGLVAGGGIFYMQIAEDLKIFLQQIINGKESLPHGVIKGIETVIESLYTPFKLLMQSTNLSFDYAMNELGLDSLNVLNKFDKFNPKSNYGFNAETITFCDLIQNGVKEPAKVSEKILMNAISLASALLKTQSIIISQGNNNDNIDNF